MTRLANTLGERAYYHGYNLATANTKKAKQEAGDQMDELAAITTELMLAGCLSVCEMDYVMEQYQKGVDDGNNI